MIRLISFIILVLALTAHAEDLDCRSQLIQMDIDKFSLQNKLTSKSTELLILKNVDAFFKSQTFNSWFVKDYPIFSFGFPFNAKSCKQDKENGLPRYRDINCDDYFLCSSKNVPEEIKSEVCFGIPCSFIKGKDMAECTSGALARPTYLHFPEPVKLKAIDLVPLNVKFSKQQLQGCFKVKSLEVSVAVDIEFDSTLGMKYERLGLKNINIVLDSPREVCMSAIIDLGATNAVSKVSLQNKTEQFVSDAMISKSLQASIPHGLPGYDPETIETLKVTVLPTLARYFRSSVEDAIKAALASTFELQISSMLQKTGLQEGAMELAADQAISELGVSNISTRRFADLIDAALIKKKTKTVPSDHPALTQTYPFSTQPLKVAEIPSPEKAAQYLYAEFDRLDHITSLSLMKKINDWKFPYKELGLASTYDSYLSPLIEKIVRAQDESHALKDIHFLTRIQQDDKTISMGLSFSKLCNMNKSSSYEGRSIPNCPISTYIDLDEMNSLLEVMYQSGRLCHQGAGDHVPETDRRGQRITNRDGTPKGSGCHFVIEEEKGGMSCYLNGAPKIVRDPSSGAYKFMLKTKSCYRGAVFAGQGKIGGDIDFDISFDPGFCGTDFCLQNGNASWKVVPGTAQYALRDSSFFNGLVKKTVDKKINEIIKGTIRIPVASDKGPLARIPFVPEGRTDKGNGFFGACMKFKESP